MPALGKAGSWEGLCDGIIRPQDFFLNPDSILKLTAGSIFRAGVGMLKCRMERVIDNICQTRQPKVNDMG
jgi:hypothetical protein